MINSLFSILIVLLAMFSPVASSPVVNYDPAFWRGSFPFLNETLVEYCYFGSTEFTSKDFGTQRADFYCSLVANQTHNCFMSSQFLEPLKQYYAKLVDNNSKDNDRLQVLKCFAELRSDDQAALATCWTMMRTNHTNDASNCTSIRQLYSKTYFDRLSQVSHKIDQCLSQPNCPKSKQPRKDFELVKHCELYHSKKFLLSHGPCGKISKSNQAPTVPLMDDISIARFFGYVNATASSAELYRNLFANALPEALKHCQSQMVACFIDDSWFEEPKHACRNITNPLDGVIYSEQDRQLNRIWQKVIDALDLE